MKGLEQYQYALIQNYIHNAKEDLARNGRSVIGISTRYSTISEIITDISFHSHTGLLKHFSTAFTPDDNFDNLYDVIMSWLNDDDMVENRHVEVSVNSYK